MTILRVEDLTKNYGIHTALHKINFEINKGEIFGFIGPNGAGKSTTIRILLGIIKATGGKATILGQNVWKNTIYIHQKIAYVPSDVTLWPNLTGGEVIDLFLKLQGTTNKRKKENLIELFDFDPSKKCCTYSKGNRQKVALISAFASDAELFILDEPTSGLDPLMEKVFQDCIIQVKKEEKSVLLSSHILSEVERLCDRVAIIRKGEIIQTGTLEELKKLNYLLLNVKTKNEVIGIEKACGIYEVTKHNDFLSLKVNKNKLGEIIDFLNTFYITDLNTSTPTLEELFMQHYQSRD